MAGNDNGDGIIAIGGADSADRGGMTDAACKIAVGCGRAAGDGSQFLPDFLLKERASGGDGNGLDGGEFSSEVVADEIGDAVRVASLSESEAGFAIVEAELAGEHGLLFGEECNAEIASGVDCDGHGADWSGDDVEEQVERFGHWE